MRTTLAIDDDIAARLVDAQKKTGLTFREIVNRTLRLGHELQQPSPRKLPRFEVKPRAMGLRAGSNDASIGEVLEQLEGRITDGSPRCQPAAVSLQLVVSRPRESERRVGGSVIVAGVRRPVAVAVAEEVEMTVAAPHRPRNLAVEIGEIGELPAAISITVTSVWQGPR